MYLIFSCCTISIKTPSGDLQNTSLTFLSGEYFGFEKNFIFFLSLLF